ncbi:hypothetical protein LU196_19250 [Pantoea sp. Mb-10]|uniref:HofO family protein n=1 Tax=unclassified Pantoea TaxID=2630326 RepID=UPI001E2D9C9D|nr:MULTISPECIES: hypothetical protein [unclassified Pantoea]MCE0492175.1 hypothetical protein [Pantoea sp. Mb-10]MCE0503204.1 hypothetical protein [Pantoea sp. Pb-8]
MTNVLARWLGWTLAQRLVSLGAGVLLLIALAWLALLQPQQRTYQRQVEQLAQRRFELTAQTRQLQAQASIETLTRDVAALQRAQTEAVPARALESLVSTRGRQLERWLPESQPQLWQLSLNWQQFLPLFSELTETTLAVPQRFELTSVRDGLDATLWLEGDHAEAE